MKLFQNLRRLFKTKVGLKDLSGTEIREGDSVLLYTQDYEEISREENYGEIPVIEVDATKPKPVPDVPRAKGIVTWDQYDLGYRIAIKWLCPDWKSSGLASLRMGGGDYAYSIAV